MRSRAKRRWFNDEWRPCFAWLPHRITFANGLAPDAKQDRPDMRMWVWLEPLEKQPRLMPEPPRWRTRWDYRLPPMEATT